MLEKVNKYGLRIQFFQIFNVNIYCQLKKRDRVAVELSEATETEGLVLILCCVFDGFKVRDE